MCETIKALLVKPREMTVTQVTLPYECAAICEVIRCDFYEPVSMGEFTLLVDEEGMIREDAKDRGFTLWQGLLYPICGNVLVVGNRDFAGDFADVPISTHDVVMHFRYTTLDEARSALHHANAIAGADAAIKNASCKDGKCIHTITPSDFGG